MGRNDEQSGTILTLHTDRGEVRVNNENISIMHARLPWEGGTESLWVIGDAGMTQAMGAVWSRSMEEALDALADLDLAGAILVDEDVLATMSHDEIDRLMPLGNYSSLADLTNVWIAKVEFKPERDYKLLCAIAEARGADNSMLDEYAYWDHRQSG